MWRGALDRLFGCDHACLTSLGITFILQGDARLHGDLLGTLSEGGTRRVLFDGPADLPWQIGPMPG